MARVRVAAGVLNSPPAPRTRATAGTRTPGERSPGVPLFLLTKQPPPRLPIYRLSFHVCPHRAWCSSDGTMGNGAVRGTIEPGAAPWVRDPPQRALPEDSLAEPVALGGAHFSVQLETYLTKGRLRLGRGAEGTTSLAAGRWRLVVRCAGVDPVADDLDGFVGQPGGASRHPAGLDGLDQQAVGGAARHNHRQSPPDTAPWWRGSRRLPAGAGGRR